METSNSSEKDRLEKIMQSEGLNISQFANEIGIKVPTISHILNGRNKPSLEVLQKVLNRFRTINSDWLILGVGSMYRDTKHSQSLSLFDNFDLNGSQSTYYNNKSDVFSTKTESTEKKQSSSIENSTMSEGKNLIQGKSSIIKEKIVQKIIVYYSDNTFQEFETK